jgi:hypothetical protein
MLGNCDGKWGFCIVRVRQVYAVFSVFVALSICRVFFHMSISNIQIRFTVLVDLICFMVDSTSS